MSALQDLIQSRADYVAIVPRDTREYGKRGFGIDYAEDMYLYLKSHYNTTLLSKLALKAPIWTG